MGLTRFDYIYFLDRGEEADEGTLEDLLERSMVFRELWRHQEEVGSLAGSYFAVVVRLADNKRRSECILMFLHRKLNVEDGSML